MTILITGAEGQLGRQLCEVFRQQGHTVFPLNKKELNITDITRVKDALDQLSPTVVINSAAYTKVDLCETEIEKALTINAFGPYYLAKVTKERMIKFLHISTDYVFSGDNEEPYKETDTMDPINMYGKSKQLGEVLVTAMNNEATIVRTSWLYGHDGHNFVQTMKRLADMQTEIRVVDDQRGCPTYAKDLALIINELLSAPPGTYHVSNTGHCTWFEFAREIMRLLKKETTIVPIASNEYKVMAPRPKNSVLSHGEINKLGIYARHWKVGLQEYIQKEWGNNE